MMFTGTPAKKIITGLFSVLLISNMVMLAAPQKTQAQSFGDITTGVIQAGASAIASCVAKRAAGDVISSLGGGLQNLLGRLNRLNPNASGGTGNEVPVKDGTARSRLKETIKGLQNVKELNIGQNKKQATRITKADCLDGAAYSVAQQILRKLQKKSINWVQSGFQRFGQSGQPGFVQNIRAYSQKLSDQGFARFMKDTKEETDICGAISKKISGSLATQYTSNGRFGQLPDLPTQTDLDKSSPNDCALQKLIGNPEDTQAFLSGDFDKGGLDALAATVRDPGSNPIISTFTEEDRLQKTVSERVSEGLAQVRQGDGFVPQRKCPNGSLGNDGRCYSGGDLVGLPTIITPGQTVGESVQNSVDSDSRRLENADELNEVVGALAGLLVSQIFESDSGLANANSGDISYQQPSTDTTRGTNPNDYLLSQIKQQIKIEEDLVAAVDYLAPRCSQERQNEIAGALQQCVKDGKISQDEVDKRLDKLSKICNQVLEDDRINDGSRKKVNWLGNNFKWSKNQQYGLGGECSNYSDAYRLSYTPDTQAGEWEVQMCMPADNNNNGRTGQFNKSQNSFDGTLKPLESVFSNGNAATAGLMNPPLFRQPTDKKKVDWNGQQFEWKYYNIFAGDFVSFITDNQETFKELNPDTPDRAQVSHTNHLTLNGNARRKAIPNPPVIAKYKAEKLQSGGAVGGSAGASTDTNRYGAKECNQGAADNQLKSYIVNPRTDVWVEQVCTRIDHPSGGDVLRFVNTGQTFPAFKDPQSGANSLEELRKDALALLNNDTADGDNWDGLRKLKSRLETALDNNNDSAVEQVRKEFNDLVPKFHLRSTVDKIESAKNDYESTFSDLTNYAEANDCSIPSVDTDNNNNTGGPEISTFTASRSNDDENIISVTWQADAGKCTASNSRGLSGWSGRKASDGNEYTAGLRTSQSITLTLRCQTDDTTVEDQLSVPATQ